MTDKVTVKVSNNLLDGKFSFKL